MVRNAASMDSLHTRTAALPIRAAAEPQPETAPLQRLDQQPTQPAVQLCGDDPFTKALMTKVATGQASLEERFAFEQRVRPTGTALPFTAIRSTARPDVSMQPAGAPAGPSPAGEFSKPPVTAKEPGKHALQDYEMQLMLLEQQNKKRLMMARQEQENVDGGVSAPAQTAPTTAQRHAQLAAMSRARDAAQAAQAAAEATTTSATSADSPAVDPARQCDPANYERFDFDAFLASGKPEDYAWTDKEFPQLEGPKPMVPRAVVYPSMPERPSRAESQSPKRYNPGTHGLQGRQGQLGMLEQKLQPKFSQPGNKPMVPRHVTCHSMPEPVRSTAAAGRRGCNEVPAWFQPMSGRAMGPGSQVGPGSYELLNQRKPPAHMSTQQQNDWQRMEQQQQQLAHQQRMMQQQQMMAARLANASVDGQAMNPRSHNMYPDGRQPAEQHKAAASPPSEDVHMGKYALQDYPMQLMLLEHQNKKRLLQNQTPEQVEQLKQEAEQDKAARFKKATRENASKHTKPFCDFLTDNPTVFHCVAAMKAQLAEAGFEELSERNTWEVEPSGKYYVHRNGSSLIAFVVGAGYKPGNGAAILAGHVDALTAKLKPFSQVPNKAGYLQLGVAPYAGALNSTWWDRDLGIGGRVLVREGNKIVTKLVKLDWPIARVPTLAPHFGAPAAGPFNLETQMVPIIGLDDTDSFHALSFDANDGFSQPPLLRDESPVGSFVTTQPPALVKAIGKALGMNTNQHANIVNWELELFDVQPAAVGGLNKEFIFAGRIDDKLCSWAALQALIESAAHDTPHSSLIKVVGLFDDEEIGSLLRQGARGNFLPQVMERAVGSLADHKPASDLMGRTYANSFLVSSDVTHAVNPNFLNVYLENHAPHLNVGLAVSADSNGHMTTDAVSTAILKRCADKIGAKLQVFQIRNDSRSGGTVGPMLSSMTGIRAIDAGIPQLSMHSIRATTGALDPGLGVLVFTAFLNGFEEVDAEFRQ